MEQTTLNKTLPAASTGKKRKCRDVINLDEEVAANPLPPNGASGKKCTVVILANKEEKHFYGLRNGTPILKNVEPTAEEFMSAYGKPVTAPCEWTSEDMQHVINSFAGLAAINCVAGKSKAGSVAQFNRLRSYIVALTYENDSLAQLFYGCASNSN